MMETREYSTCQNIPVHDLDHIITVSDIGHKCSTGCTSLITPHSDSEEEDSEVQLNLPQETGQDSTILIQGDVHEDENIENTSVKTVVKSESLSELPADKSMCICTYCGESSAESYDVIQCSDCKVWCHYQCTRLPLYQIYIYDLTSRKYTCEQCVEVPEDVKAEYRSILSQCAATVSVAINTEASMNDVGINTVSPEKLEIGVNTLNPVMKEVATEVDLIKKGIIHDGDCQCKKMEGDFVKLIDRMTETRGQLNKKNETSANTNNLMKEDNSFNVKEQKQRLEVSERKLKEASNRADKAEKVCQEMQVKLNSTFIKNEIEQSKLRGEIDILNNKLKTERFISEALQSDMENLETRYQNRNAIIIDYDNKMKSQVLEINKLNEEILSLKLHSCRVDDSLLQQNLESRLQENSVIEITPEKKTRPVAKKRLDERPLIVPSDSRHATPSVKYNPTPVIKDNGRTKSKEKSNKPTETDNSLVITPDSRNPEIGNSPSSKRKQILLVGTSNIRYLNAKLIAGRNSYIKKVTKYTVNEAKIS